MNLEYPEFFTYRDDGRLLIEESGSSLYTFTSFVRKLESALLKLYDQGQIRGTVHTCIGQEMVAAILGIAFDNKDDFFLSTHRNHGHFIASGGSPLRLYGEVLGKDFGACGCLGGSQIMAHEKFYSSGIQGGLVPIATGIGQSLKLNSEKALAVSIIGDGTLGQGVFYESMNLASLYSIPVIFVIEQNDIAQTTYTKHTTAGDVMKRADAFGIDAMTVQDISEHSISRVKNFVEYKRKTRKPGYIVIETRRLGPHSKSDDLRDVAFINELYQDDFMVKLSSSLSKHYKERIDSNIDDYIDRLTNHCCNYKNQNIIESEKIKIDQNIYIFDDKLKYDKETYRYNLNSKLYQLLENDDTIYLVGEDIGDPDGGAFKVTKGLSSGFPKRVINTPISEAAFTGFAIGMSMSGLRPIVEIMFSDFLTLIMDQILNHACKIPYLFPCCKNSVVIRSPSGGYRGYGPIHSQSLEYLFQGMPGLCIISPSIKHNPGLLLELAVYKLKTPCLFIEHKSLYSKYCFQDNYYSIDGESSKALFPTLVNKHCINPDITLIAYGGMLTLAEMACVELEKEELEVEILVPSQISPVPEDLINSIETRNRIIIVSEIPEGSGFASALLHELNCKDWNAKYRVVSAKSSIIPASKEMEMDVLPQVEDVVKSAKELF